MTSDLEKLQASKDLRQFPILAAALASIKRCPVCKHSGASSTTVLRAAITMLHNNKEFIAFIDRTLGLPAVIGGIKIDKV